MSGLAHTENNQPNRQKHGVIALQMISACHPRLIVRVPALAGSVTTVQDAGRQGITT
jgi:hypothetical protein